MAMDLKTFALPAQTVEVFTRVSGVTYESASILDIWKSLSVTINYYTANSFSATVLLTPANIKLFVPDTLLLIDKCFYYVDKVTCDNLENGTFQVSGNSLFAKTSTRIVYRTYTQTKRAELICYDHLRNEAVAPSDSKRKIGYLDVASPAVLTSSTIQYQNSYGVVQEEIETLCDTYDFGFKEVGTFSNGAVKNQVTFFKGRDLSNIVEFSAEFENIGEETYENSNYDERTTALIWGEGEGSERKHTQVNNSLTGIDRKELYVDARDLQKTTDDVTMTDAQYLVALQERGKKKLAELPRVLAANGTVDLNSSLFVYGVDYEVGDRVKRTSTAFGIQDSQVLTSVTKTWDETGTYLDGVFGRESKVKILGK